MEDMARAEYPAMLAALQPSQAAHTLNERMKRMSRVNHEIADWLQERRRVEEQYVQGLKKLTLFKVPNAQSELGVFQAPWNRIVDSTESIAHSHHQLADRIEKDIEHPLRNFGSRKDVQNMTTMANNLTAIAKDLEESQERVDKLTKKGGRANTSKVDAASSKLESATGQWESQAPFIFESLQALDESRVNNLRDLLTQYQTHESDSSQRVQENAMETLALMLEIDTNQEIQSFVNKATAGKAKLPTRTSTRQSSFAGTTPSTPVPPSTADSTNMPPPSAHTSSPAPVPAPTSSHAGDDDVSENNSVPQEKQGGKLRRLGTMFGGRRRQSMHAGFGQLSPGKLGPSFGRLGTSHSQNERGPSPRGSSNNLQEHHRLSSLAETPDAPKFPDDNNDSPRPEPSHENTNGVSHNGTLLDSPIPQTTGDTVNGNYEPDLSDVQPPPGPPPSHKQESQSPAPPPIATKDAEGFNVPPPMNDPISEAQREAQKESGEDPDQLLKVNIQQTPVEDEDPDAKLAAMSIVANSLKLGPATRRSGTVRGRRDVRHTMYVPPPNLPESGTDSSISALPVSPILAPSTSKGSAVAALASEASIAGTSDTQSVRSGNSLGGLNHPQHAQMTAPGLNTSIIESVSAIFEDGVIKSMSITGEVAFINNPSDFGDAKSYETIRINNFAALERIGPNRIFVQNSSPDHNDQFNLDVSHLTKNATAFSYRVFSDDSEAPTLGEHAPIVLKPAWKPQGDKLGLLLQYYLNPSSKLAAPVSLHNVVIVATYEGRSSGAQTKPVGIHLKDKHLVYWRIGDLTLTTEPQKIVCRIIGAEGAEPKPGHIEARWEYTASGDQPIGSGISISRLDEGKGKGKDISDDDPFADDSASTEHKWVDVPASRKLVSGKYEGR
ncbi:related to SYP1 Protein with a potential role in actin cytoskeletal organization [Fusarium torulosum]|uniref:Related to SYP1 Protein with a potential role in actin cytoskeletal organization n=1 Tax=Fusarium torulosum TaxID=33205 RepID=A0AAE8SKL6_9HYPO|nr:related to SYP1 Protein with a potential role in actin cytoskeletal organization [Fusarium torulosum]